MASHHPGQTATTQAASFGAPTPAAHHSTHAPMGTFAPGTKIQVGNHKVIVQKYLSEGGFAHVYLVKLPKPIDGTEVAVLKRVAVPDKDALANMRTEVETMKKLKGHRPIVTYFDSHASSLKNGGYEVFLLMEYCNGGGLIDFMNTRLQNRLTEPEILKIFTDVSEGVACMHYLKPPLLHRDLKVENVLINSVGHTKRFKLCDFGSTAPPRPAATTAAECRLIEDDVQKHTTLQYRSPEMIDVYRKLPIDEKSDIWALGVLLYKLCYYTTPFEEQGQLAILNASFRFPSYPPFSDPLKKLIASMLKESPRSRPNIYQVVREVCLMQGLEVPIRDIYAARSQSEVRRNQQLPPTPDQINQTTPQVVGAVFSPPPKQQQVIPDVVPMRRGRLPAHQPSTTKPSTSPMRSTSSDPFAALDKKNGAPAPADDLSARFPNLDQFSLMHDHGHKFDFDPASSSVARGKDINQRVTERLADDAFVSAPPGKDQMGPSRASRIIASTPELQSAVSPPDPTPQTKPKALMVSQGTMTTPSPPPEQSQKLPPPQIYRFPPSHPRASSTSRAGDHGTPSAPTIRPESLPRSGPSPRHLPHIQPSSSRPSLEGGRPSAADISEPIPRTRSAAPRSRPTSTYLESNIDLRREREISSRSPHMRPQSMFPRETAVVDDGDMDETIIENNVDFLRSMEDDASRKERRQSSHGSSKHGKRASLVSGTKTLLVGKFGDAFKRFETSNTGPDRASSPLMMERRDLTPIAGSEATDGRSDNGQDLEDEEEAMTSEQRRELERRRLSMEERRVAEAAAEYRRRLAAQDEGGAKPTASMTRAKTIQSKVQSLLDENNRPAPPKTAEGYGRYTDTLSQAPAVESSPPNPYPKQIPRKPIALSAAATAAAHPTAPLSYPKPRAAATISVADAAAPTAAPALVQRTAAPRPSAPPKPLHLNRIATGPALTPSSTAAAASTVSAAAPSASPRDTLTAGIAPRDDYLADFSKRFPSLSGIEMVETAIGKDPSSTVRTKEV